MKGYRIIVVDDDEVANKNLVRLLSREGYDVSGVKNGKAALSLISKSDFDLVLTDLVMDDIDGMEVLSKTKGISPDIEVIVITGYASIPSAIKAMKKGAYHYLEKPVRPEEVLHIVARAMEKRLLQAQVHELREALKGRQEEPLFIGDSREIQEVLRLIKQVAKTDCNVLLIGESGTGKELAASLIHYHSLRFERKFLAINCGGFTEDLLANELFGHEKGAFTGATSRKIGLLETANGGTLLLDEVGDMPLSMQVKLLRVLEEQELIRVGGNQPIPIDVRIIAATNQELKKKVEAGLFRQDLYFRLDVVSIFIPPLRNRKKDIPLLAHFFLDRSVRKTGKQMKGFSDQAMKVLIDYDFPGNVRELENIVERAVALGRNEEIGIMDLPPDLSEMHVFSFDHPHSNIKSLKELQWDYIQWVLSQVGRNKAKAARLLGINRTSLWRYLKNQEIED